MPFRQTSPHTWEARAQAILRGEPNGMTAVEFGARVGKSKTQARSVLGKLAIYGRIKCVSSGYERRYYARDTGARS